MRILCLQEAERATRLSEDFLTRLRRTVRARGHELEVVDLARGELAFCFGCLRCWSTGSGRCVNQDRLPELEERLADTELIVFLTPVLFGTFCPPIKTLIEKGFGSRLDRRRLHPQLIVGYGEALDEEEVGCFLDTTRKHRGAADVVHPELAELPVQAQVTRSRQETTALLRQIERAYL